MALIGVDSAHIIGNNCILEQLNNMFNKPDKLQFANCHFDTNYKFVVELLTGNPRLQAPVIDGYKLGIDVLTLYVNSKYFSIYTPIKNLHLAIHGGMINKLYFYGQLDNCTICADVDILIDDTLLENDDKKLYQNAHIKTTRTIYLGYPSNHKNTNSNRISNLFLTGSMVTIYTLKKKANCTIETKQLNLSEGENKYITEAFRKQKINIYDIKCPVSVDNMLSVLSKIGISIVGNMPTTIDLVSVHEQYIIFTLKNNQYTIKL